MLERKQEILKRGSIPEFVQIGNALEYYQVYTEANLKNKLLVQSQAQQQAEQAASGLGSEQRAFDLENIDLNNIKDDVIVMQFKLVRKDSLRIVNTQTFVNVPVSKLADTNLSTLIEIVSKQNQKQERKPGKKETFLPFNKSILTRILYPQLTKHNLLVVNHFSKKTILRHLTQQVAASYQSGPAKGLFNSLFKLGFDNLRRLTRKKLSQQQALKILQKTFKTELRGIFEEIDMFREGIKSFEVYTEQTANQLQKAGN